MARARFQAKGELVKALPPKLRAAPPVRHPALPSWLGTSPHIDLALLAGQWFQVFGRVYAGDVGKRAGQAEKEALAASIVMLPPSCHRQTGPFQGTPDIRQKNMFPYRFV